MRRSNTPAAPRHVTPYDGFRASIVWTLHQIAWFFRHCRDPVGAAYAWLQREQRKGLVHSEVVDAIPPQTLTEPLFVHRPGRPRPDYDRLAYQLALRSSRPTVSLRAYYPTRRFGKLHGSWTGSDRLPDPAKVSHNLLQSSVWLHYCKTQPDLALNRWVAERKLQFDFRRGRYTGPIPDGLIRGTRHTTAIEVGGHYPAAVIERHVNRFRRARCKHGPLHFEIW